MDIPAGLFETLATLLGGGGAFFSSFKLVKEGEKGIKLRFGRAVLDKEGIASEIIEAKPGRGNLVARLKGNGSKQPILLMGHMDTVHPVGTLSKLPFRRDGAKCYGPAIFDINLIFARDIFEIIRATLRFQMGNNFFNFTV